MSGRDVLGSSGGDHSDYALDSAFSCAAFAKLVLPIRSLADGTTLGNPVCIGLVGTKSLTSTVGNGSLGTDNRFLAKVEFRRLVKALSVVLPAGEKSSATLF